MMSGTRVMDEVSEDGEDPMVFGYAVWSVDGERVVVLVADDLEICR